MSRRRDESRLGANLLWLVPGVVGGSEDYTVRLLDSFARQATGHRDLTLFVNRAFPPGPSRPDGGLPVRWWRRWPAPTRRCGWRPRPPG